MPETDIASAESSDLTNAVKDFTIQDQTLDTVGGQSETVWQSTNWSRNLGYYKQIPELKAAIDTKVTWTIGAGIEGTEETIMLLDTIRGNGKDSFNNILKNQHRVSIIDGDSYAEIIRDNDGILANLKPLDPSKIKSIWSANGRIKRYEQEHSKKFLWIFKRRNTKFKPNEIFHLTKDRVGDEVHGTSVIDAVKWIIDARNEAMSDYKRVMHRNIDPLWIYHMDTDDVDEITEFKRKNDLARGKGENMYVPKGVVVPELVSVAANATLNPLAWIDRLNDYFWQQVNVPQIITGNAKEFTDASGKIVYLAHEQNTKAEQLYLEEQVLLQLNVEINLIFPASLQSDAVSDTPTETDTVEEEPIEDAAQANDTTEELEGKT